MITFPRPLPSMRFREGSALTLYRQTTMAPTRGGLVQVAELGAPLWRVHYETPVMPEALGAAWEAWVDSLRSGARTFQAVHPFRRLARAYPAGYGGMTRFGGGAFDGTATLDAVAVTLDTVTLGGLPATFELTVGDFISFSPSGTRQALHRVVEGAIASDGVATVAVEPTIRPGYTLGVDVALAAPWFKAIIDQTTVEISWQASRKCVAVLEAWQTLS